VPDPVVSNTTPTLAGDGMLGLLSSLYTEVWIPPEVQAEYQNGIRPGEPDLVTLAWIKIHLIQADPALAQRLDAGEAAAPSLALSSHARLVLVDERNARRVATSLGRAITGSLSVLIEAKKLGHIAQVAPIVDRMIAQGRRFSARLRAAVLNEAGE
ncbi:MAG TPA: DUF3368 domain-containing protein, partial [Ktedonobacterales bacterium]|nr:DUF3368 domain-containing protein [Ktedonobacterales bacterium]